MYVHAGSTGLRYTPGDTFTAVMDVETKSFVLDSLDSESEYVSRWEFLHILV